MSDIKKIAPLFDAIASRSVLIIGDVMIDAYLWGKVDRISPEAPVPIVSITRRESLLGGAANVALNIKSLEAIPYLCSVVGNDARGEEFIELLKAENISPVGIIKSDYRKTTVKFRILGNNTQLLRVDEENDHDLSASESKMLIDKVINTLDLKPIDVIILQDYNKGVLSPSVIDQVLRLAAERNIRVVVDPKKRNFDRYIGVTLFKPNLKEIREGMRMELVPGDAAQLEKAVSHLQQQLQAEMILVTLGEKGMMLRHQTDGYYTLHAEPAHKRHIADVSGAGDTVISVVAVCLAAGADTAQMVFLANLAGSIVCEYAGVVPVDKNRLMKEAIALSQTH